MQKTIYELGKNVNTEILSYQGFSCESKIKEKPFYVTARVKKEGVQALSLRSKAIHNPLFFTLFSYYSALSLFFSPLNPCPYEKSADF